MLYNKNLKKTQTEVDCLTCPLFDKVAKRCGGFGKICFEIDPITNIVIDPITKLPINIKEKE